MQFFRQATGYRPPDRLGEILLSRGEVSEEQLREAAEIQESRGGELGKTLLSLGHITAEALARALATLHNVEYVELSEAGVESGAEGIVEEEVLRRHHAVPLRVEGGRLVVAMSDPDDHEALSELSVSAGQPIAPVVAAEDVISELLDREFSGEGDSERTNGGSRREAGRLSEVRGRYVAGGGSKSRLSARSGKIGDILVAEGKISEEQLEQALSMQQSDPRDLGEILISLGFVTAPDLAQALARRLKLDYVVISELSADEVDAEALNLIGEETLRKYSALPLRFEDGHLIVAMSDPNDLFSLEDLRLIARRPIRPVVATREDIEGAYAFLFGSDDGWRDESVSGEEPETEVADEPAPAAEEPGAGEVEEEPPTGAGSSPGTALERMPGNRRIGVGSGKTGEILLSEGKITAEQLQRALDIQRTDPREIGKILLSLGYVGEVDLARALATRLRLDYIELSETDVDRSVASLIEPRLLRKYGVVPIRVRDGRMLVAMSDPTNIHAIEDLMMISGHPVTPVVALEREIQRVLNKVFAIGEGVEELLQEAAGESVEDVAELELGTDVSADEAPIIRLVSSILQQAVGDGASDVHVEPRARELTVRFRVDGVLREVMSIPPKLQSGVIARLKILANLDIAERRVPQDGRFSVRLGGQKIDFRVAALPTVFGEKLVLRLLDTSSVEVDLAKLGFAPSMFTKYQEVFNRPYGTILVTGPTGSGKSTTLYATLGELNSPERNIITVEDPVEYRMPGVNQVQVNSKIGLTFASGLRSILRSDPDIVMIGEIRDFETAKISVEAALTGHLVLATLHTNNAPAAVNRLIDMGVEPFLTSSAIDCVIAQRLARRLCEYCSEPLEVDEETLSGIKFPFKLAGELLGDGLHFRRAVGCNRCGGTGYKGRVGIYEMMVATEEIRELILKRVSTDEIARVAEREGMVRLRDDGLLKAARGVTTIEEVLRTVV
jgi:type IV pilus assembly protein PilB